MVLDDDNISRLTPERMRPVISCKVDGIRTIMSAFAANDVECVVLFSSAASALGNPSQSNYSAANAFLDAYAAYLCGRGYRAITVNLGVVEDVGILALDYRLRLLLTAKGFSGGLSTMNIAQSLEMLVKDSYNNRSSASSHSFASPQFILGSFDWSQVSTSYTNLTTRFVHLIDHTILDAANASSHSDSFTLESLTQSIAQLLGVKSDKLDSKEPLTRHGLDSLLAVELSSVLKKRFAIQSSQMELLGGLTVDDLYHRGLQNTAA
jgi:aryl carrier-like protein